MLAAGQAYSCAPATALTHHSTQSPFPGYLHKQASISVRCQKVVRGGALTTIPPPCSRARGWGGRVKGSRLPLCWPMCGSLPPPQQGHCNWKAPPWLLAHFFRARGSANHWRTPPPSPPIPQCPNNPSGQPSSPQPTPLLVGVWGAATHAGAVEVIIGSEALHCRSSTAHCPQAVIICPICLTHHFSRETWSAAATLKVHNK